MDDMCRHVPKGAVSSNAGFDSFATTKVCDLPACIDEAKQWVNRVTFSTTAVYVADGA